MYTHRDMTSVKVELITMCLMSAVVCPGHGEGHGSRAAEDSVATEKCEEGSREEEISGC